MNLPWRWLLPEDEQRFAALPAPGPVPAVHPGTVATALTQVGGETPAVLLLIGWTAHALDLLALDPHRRVRAVVWAMADSDLAHAHAEAERLRQLLPGLLVAPYAHAGELSRIVERLPPLGWSAAVLSDDAAFRGIVARLRSWSLSVASTPPSRVLSECGNLLARETRLGDGLALTAWRNGWAGRTALCLAGGPSLDRDLPFVRQWMERCVVIAADVVATRLAAAGIRIDFIVNADVHGDVANRIACPGDPATVLIMPLSGHAELDLRCPRRSYEGADPLAGELLGRDHAYSHGSNVGSCTVGFAEYLGCDEIVLVGHDLSYDASAYYSALVAGQQALTASNLAYAAGFAAVEVPGNGGAPVRTTPAFTHGIDDLAGFAAAFNARGGCIRNRNSNAGNGALIPGTSAVPAAWQPRGDGVAPRPGVGRTLRELWRGEPPSLRARIAPACAAYAQLMRSLPSEPRQFLRGALDRGPELEAGHALLAPFCRPALLQLALHAWDEGGSDALLRGLRSDVLAALDRAVVIVGAVLAGAWQPSAPPASPADAIARELDQRAPLLPPDSLAATLLPLIRRDLRDACILDPAFPTPRASGVSDGIHILSATAGTAPSARLHELLALVAALPPDDPLRYVAEIAARHGVPLPAAISTLPRQDDLDQLPLLHPLGAAVAIRRARRAHQRGGDEALSALINSLPGHDLRVTALHGCLAAEHGPVQAIIQVAELGVAPLPAALIGDSLRACLGASSDPAMRRTLCQVHLALIGASRAAGPAPSELAAMDAVQGMIERAVAILGS